MNDNDEKMNQTTKSSTTLEELPLVQVMMQTPDDLNTL